MVPADLARHLGANGEAAAGGDEVLLRPERIGLEIDPSGPAEVVHRTFLGHDVLYRVRLTDGTLLAAQRPSNEHVPLGSRVNVRLHAAPAPSLDAS